MTSCSDWTSTRATWVSMRLRSSIGAALAGVARAHAIAAVIEDTADQQGLGLHPCGFVTVHLFAQLGLDGLEQVPIDNGWLLALEDLTLKQHVSDIEAIAEQMGERSARERDAAYGLPGLERPHLGDDAPLAQVGHEQIEAAELEVAAEDGSDRLCFRLIDRNPAILRVIAERCHAADPETLALGGGDLVPDALGGDLALELGK